MLTVCRDDELIATTDVGRWLKAFDRAFAFEHRFRNQTHHAARFDYTELNRLGLVELLGKSFPDDINKLLSPRSLYQKEARDWVERVRSRTKTLETIVEGVAGILLKSPAIPPRTKRPVTGGPAKRAARAKRPAKLGE